MNNRFVVHNNGTSAEALVAQHRAVMSAADRLLTALRNAHPNMRDYYPLEDGQAQFEEARNEAQALMDRTQQVWDWALAGAVHAMGETPK